MSNFSCLFGYLYILIYSHLYIFLYEMSAQIFCYLFVCLFILRFYFKSSFRTITELRRKYRDFPFTSCSHTCIAPHYQNPPLEWNIYYNWCTYIDTSWSPKIHRLQYSSHLVLYILQVWANVWCMHLSFQYYTEYLHCPKNLLCSPYLSLPPSSTPNSRLTNLLTVSIVLSFLEFHVVGIVQYVAFSYRLLSLSSMCFFHLVVYI